MWALVVALGCAPDELGADLGPSPCETFWEPDEGVDYGEPWETPTVPDAPDAKLDLPFELHAEGTELLDESGFDEPSVVDRWNFDGEGRTYFRRVTREEVDDHGWQPDDVLIVMPRLLDALGRGDKQLSLTLPFYDRCGSVIDEEPRVRSIGLLYYGDFVPPVVIDRDRRPTEPRRQHSSFSYYAPPDLSSGTHVVLDGQVRARLTSDHDEAIHVRGVGLGRSFTLRGPFHDPVLTSSAPLDEPVYLLSSFFDQSDMSSFSVMRPTSSAADVVVDDGGIEQCTDGLDNDADGVGDSCDYECHAHPEFAGPGGFETILAYENSKSFGIFGDLLYCNAASEFWELELATIGLEASQFLNWVDHGEADSLNAFRAVVIGCDVRELAEARTCHDDGVCLGELAEYPLAGVGYNLYREDEEMKPGYVDLAWATSDWYVSIGGAALPMHAVVIAAQQNDPPGNFGTAGSAFSNLADVDYTKIGAAAANIVAAAPHLRVAHELGHTMGLPHDTATYIREGDESQLELPGFMNDGGGTQPILGEPDPNQSWWGRNAQGIDVYQPATIWLESVPKPTWPRSSGFGHTGCEEQTCEYFPNLSCNGHACTGPLQ